MDYAKRRLPRLQGYDYSQNGSYFVTICAKDHKCIFGKICVKDEVSFPENRLTPIGIVAERQVRLLPERFPEVRIDRYVIMPNHIHILLYLCGDEGTHSVPQIIGAYKSLTAVECIREFNKRSLFQSSFYDHIIRDQNDYDIIWNYVDTNPQRWKKDVFFAEDED